jgi:hypothetical protein
MLFYTTVLPLRARGWRPFAGGLKWLSGWRKICPQFQHVKFRYSGDQKLP